MWKRYVVWNIVVCAVEVTCGRLNQYISDFSVVWLLLQLTHTMDNFEKQFENLDVQSATMERSVRAATALSTPEDEVDELMRAVADEHGLEFKGAVDSIQVLCWVPSVPMLA